ncbi:MAG TPA: hypothetical protein DCZ12_10530 [Gammaproteobacteria bacterium]|nr:hypothetical protein [Gammaproteobacteria bacterium]HCO58744.1 hypothetical protein [Porticoccaceae bacterium]
MTTPKTTPPLRSLTLLITWACFFLPSVKAGEISITPTLYAFNYREFDERKTVLNEETGFLNALSFSVEAPLAGHWRSGFGLMLAKGTVDYDGRTQTGQPHHTETDETLNAWRYSLRHHTQLKNQYTQVGLDLAYMNWTRDIQPKNNILGLFENYRWWELGLVAEAGMNTAWQGQLSTHLSIFRVFNPEMEVDLTAVGYGQSTLNLGEKNGARIALNWTKPLSTDWQFGVATWFKIWRFGRSDDVRLSNNSPFGITIHEPASTSRHAGLNLTVTRTFSP